MFQSRVFVTSLAGMGDGPMQRQFSDRVGAHSTIGGGRREEFLPGVSASRRIAAASIPIGRA